ncbi:MAG: hypothetical protein IK051_01910 [Rhodocyclaceae bacterium]|nr:hypothetical protein [Rhodocyclaceae bacterium]
MQRRLTITLDEAVYDGLHRLVGRVKIAKFIEDQIRPLVTNTNAALEDGYKAMAADKEREAQAQEWCNALIERAVS